MKIKGSSRARGSNRGGCGGGGGYEQLDPDFDIKRLARIKEDYMALSGMARAFFAQPAQGGSVRPGPAVASAKVPMIFVITHDGHDCPHFVCDGCQETVGIEGWIYWRKAENGHRGTLLCYHDGCVHPEVLNRDTSAMPIKTFLRYLCYNVGFNPASSVNEENEG